jgi:hypothetical protein
MKRLIYTLATLALLLNMTLAQTTRKAGTKPQDKSSRGIIEPAASGNPVSGSGTTGRLSKWTGVDGSNSFTLGNSIIFEDKFGKLGIGTITPTSVLTVQGMIQTTLGGYKFPDGTVQTTSAANALLSVSHDTTLTGNGTIASPLGVAVPLTLQGSQTGVSFPILQVTNTGNNGSAINGFAGNGINGTAGGNGVTGLAGNSDSGEGGAGIVGVGGNTDSGTGGPGASVFGGSSNGFGGAGVFALGGRSAGTGNQARGGDGVRATGGNVGTNGKAGDGVVATGGDYPEGGTPGHGVVATGGHHGGSGVVAKGADELGGNFDGGNGVDALGGASSGAGRSSGNGIVAIAGDNLNGADKGLAGFFIGNVRILGDLNVNGTKNFRIDHPLDPENKYLVHAAIESSEVLNVYSGNVRTNKKGEAIVTLPAWFEALNKDFRYQLTSIGAPAQGLYIAEKINNNCFKIAGGKPHMEVSWQVTGIRSDAATRSNPFKVEEDKLQSERGFYLNPEAYGQSEEKGIERARNPEVMKQMKQQREEAENKLKQQKQR